MTKEQGQRLIAEIDEVLRRVDQRAIRRNIERANTALEAQRREEQHKAMILQERFNLIPFYWLFKLVKTLMVQLFKK